MEKSFEIEEACKLSLSENNLHNKSFSRFPDRCWAGDKMKFGNKMRCNEKLAYTSSKTVGTFLWGERTQGRFKNMLFLQVRCNFCFDFERFLHRMSCEAKNSLRRVFTILSLKFATSSWAMKHLKHEEKNYLNTWRISRVASGKWTIDACRNSRKNIDFSSGSLPFLYFFVISWWARQCEKVNISHFFEL